MTQHLASLERDADGALSGVAGRLPHFGPTPHVRSHGDFRGNKITQILYPQSALLGYNAA